MFHVILKLKDLQLHNRQLVPSQSLEALYNKRFMHGSYLRIVKAYNLIFPLTLAFFVCGKRTEKWAFAVIRQYELLFTWSV